MLDNLLRNHRMLVVNEDGKFASTAVTCAEVSEIFAAHFRTVAVDDGNGGTKDVTEAISCTDASNELHARRTENALLIATNGVLRKRIETLSHEKAEHERKESNALLIAFNAGQQIAVLLDETDFPVMPTLAGDRQSVVLEFQTLTVVVFPFEEKLAVNISGTTEVEEFDMPNGHLNRAVRKAILGMLELSRRENKTLTEEFTLTGVVDGQQNA